MDTASILGQAAAIAEHYRTSPSRPIFFFMDHPALILGVLARPDQLPDEAQRQIAALASGLSDLPDRFSPQELLAFSLAYYQKFAELNATFLSAAQWAAAHGRSTRQALTLLGSGRVAGARQVAGAWQVPEGAAWPEMKAAGPKPGKRPLN